MNDTLIEEIKKEIGYTEEIARCDKCHFHVELENQYVDRMWDNFCTFSNLGKIPVKYNGHCSKFQLKQNKG
jgi:hypothetical protein